MADWLQIAMGYSATGYTREEILFYIYGPPRSGKGTFTETIASVFGNVLSKEVDFQTFAERRNGDSQNFDLAPLKPTRFVAASESGKYQQLNAARIKAITGGNDIHCAFKHKDFFSYRPQFKLCLSSNYPINADVDDDAIWSRVRVIEFPTSHVGSEDKTLKQKMKSEKNLQAVLSWIVWGAVKWFMAKDGLHLPETVKESTRTARESADYVQQFIDDTMITNESAYITNADLYAEYKQWAIDNGITPKHKRALSMALSNKGFTVSQQVKIDGKNHRCVLGITSSVIPHYQ
jgi:putative DNA primase/helicase